MLWADGPLTHDGPEKEQFIGMTRVERRDVSDGQGINCSTRRREKKKRSAVLIYGGPQDPIARAQMDCIQPDPKRQ